MIRSYVPEGTRGRYILEAVKVCNVLELNRRCESHIWSRPAYIYINRITYCVNERRQAAVRAEELAVFSAYDSTDRERIEALHHQLVDLLRVLANACGWEKKKKDVKVHTTRGKRKKVTHIRDESYSDWSSGGLRGCHA